MVIGGPDHFCYVTMGLYWGGQRSQMTMAMTPSLGRSLKQRGLMGREVDRSGQRWNVEKEFESQSEEIDWPHGQSSPLKIPRDSVDARFLRHPAS